VKGHTDKVLSVSFSPDGKTLASSGRDGTIHLWDAETGEDKGILRGHFGSVRCVSFSPGLNGKMLASGGSDKTIRLWDIESGEEKGILRGHSRKVTSLSFSPDGYTLASGSYDKTVKLWVFRSGEDNCTNVHVLDVIDWHKDKVLSVSYSPDGKTLASASLDCYIQLWDAETGEEQGALVNNVEHVCPISFSPGRKLASAADDTVRVWDLASGFPPPRHRFRGQAVGRRAPGTGGVKKEGVESSSGDESEEDDPWQTPASAAGCSFTFDFAGGAPLGGTFAVGVGEEGKKGGGGGAPTAAGASSISQQADSRKLTLASVTRLLNRAFGKVVSSGSDGSASSANAVDPEAGSIPLSPSARSAEQVRDDKKHIKYATARIICWDRKELTREELADMVTYLDPDEVFESPDGESRNDYRQRFFEHVSHQISRKKSARRSTGSDHEYTARHIGQVNSWQDALLAFIPTGNPDRRPRRHTYKITIPYVSSITCEVEREEGMDASVLINSLRDRDLKRIKRNDGLPDAPCASDLIEIYGNAEYRMREDQELALQIDGEPAMDCE
jgi:WD40 repeat protein